MEAHRNVIKINPGSSQSDIARGLGVARKVVNYHIGILHDAGLIYIERRGRETACYPGADT